MKAGTRKGAGFFVFRLRGPGGLAPLGSEMGYIGGISPMSGAVPAFFD
jgi:hypothetical protein